MKKLIIIGFFCLLSIQAKADVQVEIDPSEISIDEPFRLTLTQTNLQSSSGIPDFTPLHKDFSILATERGVNYSVTNGQTQSSSTWTVALKARKAGALTIPAITVGTEQTTPLVINVAASASPQSNSVSFGDQQAQDIVLTTEVSEKNPYVNQQITYKVTLYNSKQLLDANYQGPKVENALLIPLGGGKRYQTQKNNTQYLVEEQNYAIFPQKSGPLKITSPVFTALVYDYNPQRLKAEDKPLTLDVQPIPKQFTGKIWLPAKQVKLSEQYENVTATISQGSTLVRTVRLEGVGIPAQLLPNLNFAQSDAFSVYPEKGKDNNQILQGELVSSTEIKVTYLFNKSGDIRIPELKLPWFNTTTGKEEIASLPPKTISVNPSANAPAAATPAAPVQKEEAKPAATKTKESPTQNTSAWIIAALFALAWLLTLSLWAWQKYHPKSGKSAYKKALNEFHEACLQGNPQRARDTLLKWASLHWPDAPILNLSDLSRLAHDANLQKQIHLLSQVLYKGKEKTLWRGDELWRCVQNIKQPHARQKNKANVLPPINPV